VGIDSTRDLSQRTQKPLNANKRISLQIV
jgi:hypothetical protein